ncbi:outer membrane insertion C- signal [Reichenbachiella agarivorans]|uniref:Outer membrane insertion C- signal n=1 Tax=Reichenbachiella agarivorans TaxID=2979464 RepID=A0ABY6CMW6_9BACT|nr:outer membrane insertion C- signal [Reichenbachiella agarivorans]UXP31846.1 outer membrane insertion C- signal [Reichenbachiella agarivorans]
MKKSIVAIAFIIATAIGAQAQEIGGRVGDLGGNNVAFDAVFSMGELSRIHADVSFGVDRYNGYDNNFGVGVDVLWDFFYKPFSIGGEDGFHWYAGVGPSLFAGGRGGFHHYNRNDYYNNNNYNDYYDNIFLFGVSGEFGMEYHFDFPLAVGVDVRPTLWIVEDTFLDPFSAGVMARYVFGR